MNPKQTLLSLASGGLVLSSAFVSAQENVKGTPPQREGENMPSHERTPENEVPTPFIGIVTRELEAEVRAQTGIAEGFGLLVVEVMPDGPASEAGLRQHDVLIRLNDQKLINVDQFMVLVRSGKKGEEISLDIKRAGVEQTLKIRVGERNLPPMRHRGNEHNFDLPIPNGGRFRYEPPSGERNRQWQEGIEKFQDQLREYQERIQRWSDDHSDRPRPQPPRYEEWKPDREKPEGQAENKTHPKRPEANRDQTESKESNRSVTMHGNAVRTDDTGVYTIRRENDKFSFSVRPKGGEEKTWPINTPEERESVPAEYRERLNDLERILKEGQ
jgi:hypothetical protein